MKTLNALLAEVPSLRLGDEHPVSGRPTLSSGYPALDAVLPGGGWPQASLTEVLQPPGGAHEWRLLLSAVLQCAQQGQVLLVGPPYTPGLTLLNSLGLSPQRLTCIQTDNPTQRLWSAEQALRCPDVAAVLAWLPQARPEALRRLHLAAQASGPAGMPDSRGPLLFVMRPQAAAQNASPAPLRLSLESHGRAGLSVHLFKRPALPLHHPIHLAGELPVWHWLPPLPEVAPNTPPSMHRPHRGQVHAFPTRHVVDRLRSGT